MGELREKVEARVRQEAESYPEPEQKLDTRSSYIRRCIDCNELGDGLLFKYVNQDKFLWERSAAEWMRWAGHHWQRDSLDAALGAVETVVELLLRELENISGWITTSIQKRDDGQQKALEHYRTKIIRRIDRLHSDRGRINALKFAWSGPEPLSVDGSKLDANPYHLVCANGVLDLRSAKFRDGRPADLNTRSTGVEWHGLEEKAPVWEAALLEICSDDAKVVECLQVFLGHTLVGNAESRKFGVFYGEHGNNGKGVIARACTRALGDYAGPIPSELLLDQGHTRSSAAPSPDICSLRGLRCGWASEVSEGKSFSAGRVKWLSGNDELTGRYLNSNTFIRFMPTHTLILLCNDLPHAPDHDSGFWERLYMIPFERSFVDSPTKPFERKKDLSIERTLSNELSGILAWLVRGAIKYQNTGLISIPKIELERKTYRQGENPLGNWLDDCCDLEPDAVETFKDLFENHSQWYEKHVSPKNVPTSTKFGGWLGKRFDRTTDNNLRAYKGLRLK